MRKRRRKEQSPAEVAVATQVQAWGRWTGQVNSGMKSVGQMSYKDKNAMALKVLKETKQKRKRFNRSQIRKQTGRKYKKLRLTNGKKMY